MLCGDEVKTPFGPGYVILFRETDKLYKIQLAYGFLYCRKESFLLSANKDGSDPKVLRKSMDLNIAYQALENMRKLNLELICNERGISCAAGLDQFCTYCLLQKSSAARTLQSSPYARSSSLPSTPLSNTTTHEKTPRFPRLARLMSELDENTKKTVPTLLPTQLIKRGDLPCLTCGNPTCRSHASKEFRRDKIHICLNCQRLFSLEFVVDCLTAPSDAARRKHLDHMIECYDRIRLLLQYSASFILPTAASLEASTVRQNKVGLGSSSAGLVSGVLGVAAAATILTPAGPPLLIASLFFGGSASAVQTGSETWNYYSEPNQLADRVLALHGTLEAILRVMGILRDALLRDHIRTDPYEPESKEITADDVERVVDQSRGAVLGGLTFSRFSMAGMELGQAASLAESGITAGRSTRFFSRAGTNLMRTVRVARFAGGAMSAATVVLEARALARTVKAIESGNPCEKAHELRRIYDELPSLPSTEGIDRECDSYLKTLNERKSTLDRQEVIKLLLEGETTGLESTDDFKKLSTAETMKESDHSSLAQDEENDLLLSQSGPSLPVASLPPLKDVDSKKIDRPSLLKRIELYKIRESFEGSGDPVASRSP